MSTLVAVGLTPEDIQKHGEALVSSLEIDALIHGNLAKDVCCYYESSYFNFTDMRSNIRKHSISSRVSSRNSSLQRFPIRMQMIIIELSCCLQVGFPAFLSTFIFSLTISRKYHIGTNYVYSPLVTSPENVNSAASVYYQVCPTTDYRRIALLELFSQIAKTPIFSTLRTIEQLGYIVSSGGWSANGMAGFRVMVQSEKVAGYLEERVEALWSGFGKHLEDLGEVEFGKQKESLVAKKRERVKNLGQEYVLMFSVLF